jgi:RAB protein geranylgeranyltransferase component A
MYKELNDNKFDYVIFGTSLIESILSAYLARRGKKILHVDFSRFYGGDCKNFNFKDLDHCKSFEFI